MELKEEEMRTKWKRKGKGLSVCVCVFLILKKFNSEPTMCKGFCQDAGDHVD